jgi:DNA adenine methylase
MRPILKWAGGKKRALKSLFPLSPREPIRRYFEPFFGGGAYFFNLELPEEAHAVVSDANRELMLFYDTIATSASAVARVACQLASEHSSGRYMELRDLYNALAPLRGFNGAQRSVLDSARELHSGLFLYLNKTCFNGLHRVNGKGEFNTPPDAGSKWRPSVNELCEDLVPAARKLRRAVIRPEPFGNVLGPYCPGPGDFIFCDPPYVPDKDSDNFTAYTKLGFGPADLAALEACLSVASERGASFMLTHRDTPLVRRIFKRYNFTEYMAPRSVAADGSKRQPVAELCIRNYTDDLLGSARHEVPVATDSKFSGRG